MNRDPESHDVRISDGAASRILARAAQLDSAGRGELSVGQLREAALEAGMQPYAVDAALRESGTTPVTRPAPWWVRLCMTGVPDRRAAMVYYWLFVAGLCASPLIAWGLVPSLADGALGAFAGMGYFFFALWSTSRAIRWLDEHGWNALK